MSKTIFVTGDIARDFMLATSNPADGNWAIGHVAFIAENQMRSYPRLGASALLCELLKTRAAEIPGDVKILHAKHDRIRPEDDLVTIYSMWRDYGEPHAENHVWRISSFIGFDPPRGSIPACALEIPTDPFDVLVVDDSGYGFADPLRVGTEYWDNVLRALNDHAWVVAKCLTTIPRATAPLWSGLRSKNHKNLICVISERDLRNNWLQIDTNLSWEQVADDICSAIHENAEASFLGTIPYSIITFAPSAAVLVDAHDEKNIKVNLVFDPRIHRGSSRQKFPGKMSGYNTCMAATIVENCLLHGVPTVDAIRRGISSMRALWMYGYSTAEYHSPNFSLAFPFDLVSDAMGQPSPDSINVEIPTGSMQSGNWSIVAQTVKDIEVLSDEVVRFGHLFALEGHVPFDTYGELVVVSRHEVEDYRTIREHLVSYSNDDSVTRPLAISVFGPPGSGKSFGVRELAHSLEQADLLGKNKKVKMREFNLSQVTRPEDLIPCYHYIRDDVLSGRLAIAFFDEFDGPVGAEGLGWLRYFISPLQDGVFQEGDAVHHLGRCVFIFAGGLYESMDAFASAALAAPSSSKARDFVSRVAACLNVASLNGTHKGICPEGREWILRRAVVLRSLLQRKAPGLFKCVGQTDKRPPGFNKEEPGRKTLKGEMRVDPGMIHALLTTREYKHGARSLRAIIDSCTFSGQEQLARWCLPPRSTLGLHVDVEDFLERLNV